MTINDLEINEALINVGIQKAVIGAAMRAGDLEAAKVGRDELKKQVEKLDKRVEKLLEMFKEPMGS